MKIAKLYLEYTTYRWNCWKCGKPDYFTINPKGVHNLNGRKIAGPEAFKGGFVVKCNRTTFTPGVGHVKCCNTTRKVFIEKALFEYMPSKLANKLNKIHSERLKKELEILDQRMKEINIKEREARKKNQKKEKLQPKFVLGKELKATKPLKKGKKNGR